MLPSATLQPSAGKIQISALLEIKSWFSAVCGKRSGKYCRNRKTKGRLNENQLHGAKNQVHVKSKCFECILDLIYQNYFRGVSELAAMIFC